MDCSIVPLRHKGLFTVSTTDFFFPLIEDPYVQGKIACANVLSDQYAMGLHHCDNVLMLLAASTEMGEKERTIVTRKMIEGFNDLAKEAEVSVTGGQTVLNPWPIIGGVAMSTVTDEEIIRPENGQVGDLLVLTKPLGTQVAVNLHQWLLLQSSKWITAKSLVTEQQTLQAFNKAVSSMARLNRLGAKLMHKYKAHAATDVTGFGLLGHANNLAQNQKAKGLCFQINILPIIQHMSLIDNLFPNLFKLQNGYSSETSGGLLICFSPSEASQFVEEITKLEAPAWIIGKVVTSETENSYATLLEQISIVDV